MFCEHNCPFYEEHGGEYYQGCWEFYDICWISNELYELPLHCNSGCFLIREDEEEMLRVCRAALKQEKEVWQLNSPPVKRPLTEGEKRDIIGIMETFIKLFNEMETPIAYYK